MPRLVLSLGGSAVVVAPPDVVTAVRDAAQRALAGYEQGALDPGSHG